MGNRNRAYFGERIQLTQGGNPCHGLKKRHDKSKRQSHEPWSREVLEATLKIAPKEIQVAIEVLLGAGQRVDDATKLKREHIVDGMVSVPAEPTEFQQKKTGERIFIVPTERLAKVLAFRPHQDSDYVLNSSRGRKWANGDSLSGMITRWVDEVAEPGKFTTHGLRANVGIELALSGCSIEELKAVLGHRTAQIALEYLKKMNKLHLVMSATHKRNDWERRRVAEAEARAKTPKAKSPEIGTTCQTPERKWA